MESRKKTYEIKIKNDSDKWSTISIRIDDAIYSCGHNSRLIKISGEVKRTINIVIDDPDEFSDGRTI